MKRIISLSFILLLAACSGKKESKTETLTRLKKERADLDAQIKKLEVNPQTDTVRPPVPVAVQEVQYGAFHAFIDVQSSITSDENVKATPQMAGVVRTINVQPGQYVRKGQVLAALDAAALEQQIAAQEAQLSLAQTLYQKQQELWKQQIGTEVQLLQAKAAYESASKQRAALIAQRNMYRIVAPISGVVDQVNVKVGDMASPGMTGIQIVNNSKLKAEANLGENYLGHVQAGDPVVLFFPELHDSLRARLSYVARAVDPVSRAFGVEVRLPANAKLHPNMSARMRINNYTNPQALVVPVSVVQHTPEGDMVYVDDNGRAKAVIINTGRNSDGLVEITGGLKPGDRVITEGYLDVNDGDRIAVQNPA